MIPQIVLTGGPHGGKSTALQHLEKVLPERGLMPILISEMATRLFTAGIKWLDVAAREPAAFRYQVLMILGQIQNENIHRSFADIIPTKNKVIICDRGTIDNMVYAKDEWHDDILSQVGTLGYLKRRYDGIIHLNTLAWGEGYSHESNPARHEDREGAIKVDERTFQMWERGPFVRHVRIPHSISLEDKLEQVTSEVLNIVELTSSK